MRPSILEFRSPGHKNKKHLTVDIHSLYLPTMSSPFLLIKPLWCIAWSYRKVVIRLVSLSWACILFKEIEMAGKFIDFDRSVVSLAYSNLIDQPRPTLDILSVGSVSRPKYLQSQLETWASHSSIRSFIGVTEKDDYNQTCSQMKKAETQAYINSCRANPSFSTPIKAFAGEHYSHTEGETPDTYVERTDPGWHCAQRRFGQSLRVLENNMQHSSEEALADYVVMVDDDTFFNADLFHDHVQSADPSEARMYAGCLFEANETINIPYEFPYGGFGVVFSKGAVQQMMRPIFCGKRGLRGSGGSDSSATAMAGGDSLVPQTCSAIQANRIGEQVFFREGMSVIDLISEYSARATRFCVHSDWLIGYMAKYYLDLSPPLGLESNATTIHPIRTWPNQCGNHSLVDTCSSKDMFCHRQSPDDLKALTDEIQALSPGGFRNASLANDMANTNIANITAFPASLPKSSQPPSEQDLQVSEAAKEWLNDFKSSRTMKINATEIGQRSPEQAKAWIEMLRNDTILQEQQESSHRDPMVVWKAPSEWMTPRQVLPANIDHNELAHVVEQLRNGKILKATSAPGGSQLKLLLELEGGQQVIFKPEREGPGNDLHNSEIAAFHVARLLDMRRAPISVGRRIDIEKEILPVATPEFRDTFTDALGRTNCFYGTCEFCDNPVCPRDDGTMHGVVILFLPKKLRNGSDLVLGHKSTRFPLMAWNDKDRERVELMKSKDYCDVHVKPEFPMEPRILDVVETSIFDFLIQNVDRHTHEFVDEEDNGAVLLIDQGKSFLPESAENDEMKLLLPLTSCCVVREKLYEHLQWIARWDVNMSDALLYLTSVDIASHARGEEKILPDGELASLDRRLKIVLDAVNTCVEERGRENVLVDSIP